MDKKELIQLLKPFDDNVKLKIFDYDRMYSDVTVEYRCELTADSSGAAVLVFQPTQKNGRS